MRLHKIESGKICDEELKSLKLVEFSTMKVNFVKRAF